jgi:hypothetical protein
MTVLSTPPPATGWARPPAAQRALGLVWLAAALPVAAAGLLLGLVSDSVADGPVGSLLLVLALAAVGVGAWMAAVPSRWGLPVSAALSLAWLVGALVALPSQHFLADALWVSVFPALVALGTLTTAAVVRYQARRG